MWPWQRYDDKAEEIAAADLTARLLVLGEVRQPCDRRYLVLDEGRLKNLVEGYFWPITAQLKPDFPDCDDAVRLCVADVIRASIAHGFRFAPAWGLVTVWTESAKRHQLCFYLCRGFEAPKYYDPTGKGWLAVLPGEWPEFEI